MGIRAGHRKAMARARRWRAQQQRNAPRSYRVGSVALKLLVVAMALMLVWIAVAVVVDSW
jgi:hypothetical protein